MPLEVKQQGFCVTASSLVIFCITPLRDISIIIILLLFLQVVMCISRYTSTTPVPEKRCKYNTSHNDKR